MRTLMIMATLIFSLLLSDLVVAAETEISADQFGTILNLSGRQRMLTQKMSKEVLLIALDIDHDKNLENLETTSNLFEKTLLGLRNGSEELGLPPTSSKRILRQLDKINKYWQPFYARIKDIIKSKKVTPGDIEFIAENNPIILNEMNRCVKLYEKQATKSTLQTNPGLAAAINLAGKQRMLSQKMSKEFLLIAYGYKPDTNQLNMQETASLFDRTLKGLRNGDKTLDLPETTQPAILDQLAAVEQLWTKFTPVLNIAETESGSNIPRERIQQLADLNLPLLKEMNKAVLLYEKEAAK